MLVAGPPKRINEKLAWYWENFVQGEEMTFDEFLEASKVEQENITGDKIRGYYDQMDLDKSSALSWREF
jgi:hypothetical protein